MPRPDVSRFQEHDRVVDGQGNSGVIVEIKRKSDGKPFLMVWVTDGPLRNQRVWPDAWRVNLDWDADGISTVCGECSRVFHGGKDEIGLRRIFCRKCQGEQDAQDRREQVAAAPSHSFGGSNRPRVHDRAAEEQKRAERRERIWNDAMGEKHGG